jgi:hypothetical protein
MVAGRPSIRADKATRQRSIAKVGIEGFIMALALESVADQRGIRNGARQVEGARHAIQENDGGLQGVEEAAVAVHILSR